MTTITEKAVYYLAWLAFSLAAYFAAASIYLHIISIEMVFMHDTLSQYVHSQQGELLQLGFYSISLNQLVLAGLIYCHTQARLCTTLFILAAAGAFMVGYFPVQPDTEAITKRLPHIIGAIFQFFFFPLAAFHASKYVYKPSARNYTYLTAFGTALLFLVLLLIFFSPALQSYYYLGLLEKINIIFITAWLMYIPYLFIRLNNTGPVLTSMPVD